MTNPTYYTRIEDEGQRKVALFILAEYSPHAVVNYISRYETDEDIIMAWHAGDPRMDEFLPFPDFIQRFVPIEVVGLLAGYHGYQMLSNSDTERACKVLETALETQQEVNSLVDTIQKAFIRKKGQQ